MWGYPPHMCGLRFGVTPLQTDCPLCVPRTLEDDTAGRPDVQPLEPPAFFRMTCSVG